jgi:hypothetical protein
MSGIIATIKMSAVGKLNGGIFALIAAYFLKIIYLFKNAGNLGQHFIV